MHYCEMLVGGGAPGSHDEPCDSPATIRYQGEWFCEYHYQALVDLDSRWQTLLRVADDSEPYEFADIWVDTDGGGWVVFEGVEVEGMD
jgi:hypothetical protein